MQHKISIIIPTLNEESYIGKLLEHLIAYSSSKNIAEIIVVDGGSQDKSIKIVKAFSHFNTNSKAEAVHYINNDVSKQNLVYHNASKTQINLLNGEKGRAKQMNLGVKNSTGNILYFLLSV